MAYTQEENNEFIAESTAPFQSSGNNLEDLLDLIAIALIQSPLVNTSDVENNQKFIHDGILQSGQGIGVLALFQKDIKANQEDLNSFVGEGGELLQTLADSITNFNTLVVSINDGVDYGVSIQISGGGLSSETDVTQYLVQDGTFSNVSQFIPLQQSSSIVDVDKAEEFLDTNIFELLPASDTRQSRIIRFFQELNALLPPNTPEFDLDNDNRVDREEGTNNWIGATQYSKDNSISYAQENTDGNINEEDAFIHRLKDTANDINSSRTIEDIYNTIFPYLTDILESQDGIDDTRPEYENQSSGYLQFRSPNQGIIIRNTNQEFIEGLDPNNLTYLNEDGTGGFTITMWVRFLDKASTGTLFNFGNPTRSQNPFGFKLETFVLNQDDTIEEYLEGGGGPVYTFRQYMNGDVPNYTTNQNQRNEDYFQTSPLFKNTNTERFVRLQVREYGELDSNGNDEGLRDSALASVAYQGAKIIDNPPDLDRSSGGHRYTTDELRILNYTHIPEDFNEWYFICATYNPEVDEEGSVNASDNIKTNPLFWLNHIDEDNNFTSFSQLGNRCKVEIISRTDLLRARGFKV
jgi:hypothetical protein